MTPSYFDLVQKIYLAHPNISSAELWIELCREFVARGEADEKPNEEKVLTTLFPPLPSYRALAREFAEEKITFTNPDAIDVFTKLMMREINEHLKINNFAFDSQDPFMNLLKTFLTCHPDFEEELDQSVRNKLSAKGYMPYKILDDRLAKALPFVPNEDTEPLSDDELEKISEIRLLFDLCDLKDQELKLLNNLILRISRIVKSWPGFFDAADNQRNAKYDILRLDGDFWDKISDHTISRIVDSFMVLLNQPEPGLHKYGLDSLTKIFERIPQNKLNKISAGLLKSLFDLLENEDKSNINFFIKHRAGALISATLMRADKKHLDENMHYVVERYKKYAMDTTSEANILLSSLSIFEGKSEELFAAPLKIILKGTDSEIGNDMMKIIVNKSSEQTAANENHDENALKDSFKELKQELEDTIQRFQSKKLINIEDELPEIVSVSRNSTRIGSDDEDEDKPVEIDPQFFWMAMGSETLMNSTSAPQEIKNEFMDCVIKNLNKGDQDDGGPRRIILDKIDNNTLPDDRVSKVAEMILLDMQAIHSRQDAIIALYSQLFDTACELTEAQRKSALRTLIPTATEKYDDNSFTPEWTSTHILAKIAHRLPPATFQKIIHAFSDRKLKRPSLLESKLDEKSEENPELSKLLKSIDAEIDSLVNGNLFTLFHGIAENASKNPDDASLAPTVHLTLEHLSKMSTPKNLKELLQLFSLLASYQHLSSEAIERIGKMCILFLSDSNIVKIQLDFTYINNIVNSLNPKLSLETKALIAEGLRPHVLDLPENAFYPLLHDYQCLLTLLLPIPNNKLMVFANHFLDKIGELAVVADGHDFKLEPLLELFSRLKKEELGLIQDRLVTSMKQREDAPSRKLCFLFLYSFSLSDKLTSDKIAVQMIDFLLSRGMSTDDKDKAFALNSLAKLLGEQRFIYKISHAQTNQVIDFMLKNTDLLVNFSRNASLLVAIHTFAPEKFLTFIADQSEEAFPHAKTLYALDALLTLISEKQIPFTQTADEEKASYSAHKMLEDLIDKLILDLDKCSDQMHYTIFSHLTEALVNLPDKIFNTQPYKKLLDKVFENPGFLSHSFGPGYHFDAELLAKIPDGKIMQLFHHHINLIPHQILAMEKDQFGYTYDKRANLFNNTTYEKLYQRVPEEARVATVDMLIRDLIESKSAYNHIRQNCMIVLINSLSPDKQNYFLFAVLPEKINTPGISSANQAAILNIVKEVSTHRIFAHEIGSKHTLAPSILLDYLGAGPH